MVLASVTKNAVNAGLFTVFITFLVLPHAYAGSAVAIASRPGNAPPLRVTSAGVPKEVAIRRVLKVCRERGGMNPRVIASTDKPGYGAVAISEQADGHGTIVEAALGHGSKEEAETIAMRRCLKSGGLHVRVDRSFHDIGEGEVTFRPDNYLRVSQITAAPGT